MSCLSNNPVFEELEKGIDEIGEIFSTLGRDIKECWMKNFAEPEDHTGTVKSVEPFATTPRVMEENPTNKSSYLITLTDDRKFQLQVTESQYHAMRQKLEPGRMITILHRLGHIIQIYPVRQSRTRFTNLKDVLDAEELEIADSVVKAHYLDGKLKSIEFVESMEEV